MLRTGENKRSILHILVSKGHPCHQDRNLLSFQCTLATVCAHTHLCFYIALHSTTAQPDHKKQKSYASHQSNPCSIIWSGQNMTVHSLASVCQRQAATIQLTVRNRREPLLGLHLHMPTSSNPNTTQPSLCICMHVHACSPSNTISHPQNLLHCRHHQSLPGSLFVPCQNCCHSIQTLRMYITSLIRLT